jgi:hypothetical protein
MKRPNIYFKDGKIHANTTKDKLLVSLPTIIIGPVIIYFLLSFVQANPQIFESRPTGYALVGILNVLPPIFWASLLFGIGAIATIPYIVQLRKEKHPK